MTWLVKERSISLNRLKNLSNWRGTFVELHARIIKILKSSHFTAREIRVLKRLLKLEERGEITMESVLESLPGKSLDSIIQYKQTLSNY